VVTENEAVALETAGGIAHLALNRPRVGNAIDLNLARQLHRSLKRIETDDSVRVVLLTGKGPLFCVGGDLRAIQAASDRSAFLRELVDEAHQAIRVLAALEKPVIARVQGPVAGAGLSLVLMADLVLTSPKATFSTAYSSVGLTPDCGQSWLLPRMVGMRRALELTLLNSPLSAEGAVSLGVATRVVPEETLDTDALGLASQLARGASRALGRSRRLIRSSYSSQLFEQLDHEATAIEQMVSTADSRALIDAALESAT
jgi:2-(1,2-epoxy-1,2-dihydrophenyl)acetyl-CoA isomerase